MSMSIFESVRARIEKGKIELALDELKELTNDSPSEVKREFSIHSGNFHQFDSQYRQGTITDDQYSTNRAKLNHSILQFVDELEKKFSGKSPLDITRDISIELPEDTTLEKVLGVNNLKKISWLRQGLEFSSSVCRILTPIGLGTGFMIGSGLLMTNHHVIQDPEVARHC